MMLEAKAQCRLKPGEDGNRQEENVKNERIKAEQEILAAQYMRELLQYYYENTILAN